MDKEKIRVLIAEDDPVQNELLKDALEMEQDLCCCGQAADGLQALEMIREIKPDVLLMDIIMPKMDGIDLLAELKDHPPEKRPRVIVISAFGQERIAQKSLELGADWFLLKPYQLDLLMRRIRALTDKTEHSVCVSAEKTVSQAVMELGVKTSTVGFGYLVQALEILLAHTSGSCLIGKDVYEIIAEHSKTNAQCVEKALRKAIRQIFDLNSPELNEILKFGRQENMGHLSNGKFLTLTAMYLRLNKMQ